MSDISSVGLQSGYRVEGFQVPDDDILVSITVRGGEGGERRERR
jgi:hypothetical protein